MLFSSDIEDLSDYEAANMTLPIMEDSQDDSDLANDSDESIASEYYDKEWRLVAVGVENADPVCVKLNDLIQRGKVSRNQILYKYLKDVIEVYYDPRHEYDKEVIEFFNTLSYLGGHRTTNMIRGPMFAGQGRGSVHDTDNCRMNLGGPSEETCRKNQAGYTTKSGVLKSLSKAFLKLSSSESGSEVQPLFDNDFLRVTPCVLANDGTALKPSIQFDTRTKKNVGLDFDVDVAYVRENPEPTPEYLSNHIITEVLVSSATTLDNSCSIPCAVHYVTKKGKTGEKMKDFLETQCKILQICQSCQAEAPSVENVLNEDAIDLCKSICDDCFNNKKVCDACKDQGQTSYYPSLRKCKKCTDAGKKCIRVAVLACIIDCEEGNKKAMTEMKENLEKGTVDPQLALFVPLPDSVHVGKSLKASFANWYLKLSNERGNLSMLKTLRNKADPIVRKEMRKFLPRNDHVRNKDRQDPTAVIKLTNPDFTKYLSALDFVGHTIIPETDRFTEHNKVGMYPNPISIATGPYGNLLWLTLNTDTGLSSLFMAQLHNPVQKIVKLKDELQAKEVHHVNNIVFMVAKGGPIIFHELETGAVRVNLSKLRSREDVVQKASNLNLSIDGTVAVLKERIATHLGTIEAEYQRRGLSPTAINFWDSSIEGFEFEALEVVDSCLIYAACRSKQQIVAVTCTSDGYGLRGDVGVVIDYQRQWGSVGSMTILDDSIYVTHRQGIEEVSLTTLAKVRIISSGPDYTSFAPSIAKYKSGLLFPDPQSHRILRWIKNQGRVEVFAGTGSEGNRDGLAKRVEFYQPAGLCVEFDHVVYVCDARTSCIKVFTTLTETATFLDAVGKIYKAFSIHEKHTQYHLCNLQEATSLVNETLHYLRRNEALIRGEVPNLPKSLSGPHGNVAEKTIVSVSFLQFGLKRLTDLLTPIDYTFTNLLSCLTLDVENCHSVVHHKSPLCTVLEYARNFGHTVKESVKKTTNWAAFYFTNPKSWYPVPDRAASLFEIPLAPQLSPAVISSQDAQLMKEWAHTFGAAVRQRTVRQETTMARAGTLPSFLYQREIMPGESVDLTGEVHRSEDEDGYETCSSAEEEMDEEDDSQSVSTLDREANFLLGRVSTFGRAVRFNSRLMFCKILS